MIELAPKNNCTACGACAFKCTRHCISMREDEIGMVYPVLDNSSCIECHACEKVCPILNPVVLHNSRKAYAAWTTNYEDRKTSASGGIAITAYKYALSQGYKAVGASQNVDFSVTLKIADTTEQLIPFKNSKYVFSDGYEVFHKIQDLLNNRDRIIVIGLPCQIAAIRRIFKDNENMLLVDIVCHGTTPVSYLKQHISSLECFCGKKAKRMTFRDPMLRTSMYYLSLYDDCGIRFYSRRTKDGDLYQFGYHRAISYRENCYHCSYACSARNGDLTFADYHGLGKIVPCTYSVENVSLILVNTEIGNRFVREMIDKGLLHVDEKPLEEPIAGEKQLRHPSLKTKYRFVFENEIIRDRGDFESAMQKVMKQYYRRKKISYYSKCFQRIINRFFSLF